MEVVHNVVSHIVVSHIVVIDGSAKVLVMLDNQIYWNYILAVDHTNITINTIIVAMTENAIISYSREVKRTQSISAQHAAIPPHTVHTWQTHTVIL